MEEVAGNLLRLGKEEFVALFVEEERFAFPGLIDFCHDYFAHAVLIFIVKRVVFEFKNLAGERLTESQDGTTAEVGEVDFLADVLTHFIGGIDGARVGKAYLLVVVFNSFVFYDHAVAVYFAVALIGVDDNVEIFV